MVEKIGRNDPCPCGSGKKYKHCHMKENLPAAKKKFKATKMGERKPVDLMERTYGSAVAKGGEFERPPVPPEEVKEIEEGPLTL